MRTKSRLAVSAAATVALASVCVLASCSPAPEDDWTTQLKPAWTVEATLMSPPVIAGDTVLAYVHEPDDSESIVAWDGEKGSEPWRATALPARTSPGVDHAVAVIEKDGAWQVAFLAPRQAADAPNSWMRLTVADVRTGRDLLPQLHDDPLWTRRPTACKDASTFCLEGHRKAGPRTDGELVLIDGALVNDDDPEAGFNENGFLVGNRVSLSYGDVTEVRYGIGGVYTRWRLYEDVFGPGTDSTGGWAWYDDDEKLPVIGWGDEAAPDIDSYPYDDERDLTAGRTVGLDRTTGKTLWIREHTAPCRFTAFGVEPNDDGIIPLCRFRSGSLQRHFEAKGQTPRLTYRDVDIDLIGVDAASGAVVWTVPLGDEPRNYARDQQPKAPWSDSDDHVIAIIDGVRSVVDLHDGSQRALPSEAEALCKPHDAPVTLTSIWKDTTYLAATNTVLCDAKGRVKQGAQPSTAALALAGFDIHDDVAMVFDGRLAFFTAVAPTARPSTAAASPDR